MPFVPNAESFLCLALCGSIKDGVVPPPILADFLLYHLNLIDPRLYTLFYEMEPTNEIEQFLAGIAQKTGKLLKGGKIDETGAAMDVISRFRKGQMGQWAVDLVTPQAFDVRIREEVLARQREFKGGRKSLSVKVEEDGRYSLIFSQNLGKAMGVMARAIEKGRNDAKNPRRKAYKARFVSKRAVSTRLSVRRTVSLMKEKRLKYKKGKPLKQKNKR
jgi:hypothetical protein